MSATADRTVEEHLAFEADQRPRAVVAAVLGGVCTLVGPLIYIFAVQHNSPTVGPVQALTPALQGHAAATVDPHAAQVVHLHQHAVGAVISQAISFIGLVALAYVLWYLYRAVRARQPVLPRGLQWMFLGAILAGGVTLGSEIALVIKAASFVTAGDHSPHAVKAVLDVRNSGVVLGLGILGQLATLASIVFVSLQALRVGLLTRFMGILGVIVGILFLLPFLPPWLLEAFWMGALAPLFALRWPNGVPPAWLSGRAEPWPPASEMRERRRASLTGQRPAVQTAGNASSARAAKSDDESEPVRRTTPHPSSRKRKRKRR